MAILINDTAPRNQYTATSGQTVFTVSFEFFENADLKVYKNAVLQTITTHYTVTGAGVTGGGSITLTSGATAGDIITIVRDIPVKRVTDFPTSGPFNISALNAELDKIIAMVQEREDDITRVVQLSDTDTSTSLTLPLAASRASKVLGFDATGNTIVMQELGNYRGNWASGTAYVLRDIIKDTSNASIYICVQAHTSSGSQPISTNPNVASWALLIDGASAAAAAASASAAASSASAAAGSASSASTSASNASTSASNASTSATNASNSASGASTSATNAANSASSASTSATNAANSATSAAGSAATATTQASNASSSASSAAASASTATAEASSASTSANNATSSAFAAQGFAASASSSASSASTSATSAAAARTAAESARDATLAAYDNFDDRYLGTKTSNPALDNDGNALVAGALYFNSVAGEMRLWTGSAWVAAYVSGTGFLSTSGGTITGDLVVNASGSTDGVRITQTGTGNALIVEDSTNPDATPVVIDNSGRLLIGTTNNVGAGTFLQLAGTANNAVPASMDFTKDRAGAAVVNGDSLGWFRWWGLDASPTPVYQQAASIEVDVSGTPGVDLLPSTMTFRVRSENNIGFGENRLQLQPYGQVQIGGGVAQGPASTINIPTKIRVAGTTYTDSTTAASGTAAHGTTVSFGASNLAAINTGVTYTNASTLYIHSAPAAGTNVTITNPYALYVLSGASYFGGQVQGPAGSAAAPSFTTSGDTNTGMFFPAADTIALSAGGTEDFRIGPAGQIGIGGANYGTAGQVLTSGGASAAPSWATITSTGRLINTQVFTSSGTYTRTAGVTTAVVICRGGGGGGGSQNAGSTGGTTSFGSHVTAVGGSGGAAQTTNGQSAGGAGGTGGTGALIAIRGEPGETAQLGYVQFGCVGTAQLPHNAKGGGEGAGPPSTAGVRGGGGGGGTDNSSKVSGGGGQGELAIDYITTVGATETVTIGAGGAAGTFGSLGGAGGAGYIIVYEYS